MDRSTSISSRCISAGERLVIAQSIAVVSYRKTSNTYDKCCDNSQTIAGNDRSNIIDHA